MDAARLRQESDRLVSLATELVDLDHNVTGRSSDRPAQDLGNATVRFATSLRDLADAGEMAELALSSAILAGDAALDAFAWAELTRRGKAPSIESRTGEMPTLWPTVMQLIDDDPEDPMTASARYLDVNLDIAREAIAAQRDHLTPFDADRLRRALDMLREIRWAAPRHLMPETAADLRSLYESEARQLSHAARNLGREDRERLRNALQFGGIESPELSSLAMHFGILARFYLGRRSPDASG